MGINLSLELGSGGLEEQAFAVGKMTDRSANRPEWFELVDPRRSPGVSIREQTGQERGGFSPVPARIEERLDQELQLVAGVHEARFPRRPSRQFVDEILRTRTGRSEDQAQGLILCRAFGSLWQERGAWSRDVAKG